MKKLLMLGLIALLAVGTSWATGDELTAPLNSRELSGSNGGGGQAGARGGTVDADDDARGVDADVAGRSIADRRGRMVRMGTSSVVPEELGWKSRWKKKKKKDDDDDDDEHDDEDEDGDMTPMGP